MQRAAYADGMTEIYDRPLLKAPMAVACPSCGAEAVFRTPHNLVLPTHVAVSGSHEVREDWSGEVRCLSCTKAGPHQLDWPADAWFRVEHRGETLWALDRSMMTAMRDFIAAGAERSKARRESVYWDYLLRIPSGFLAAKARETVLKTIDACLAGGPDVD